jgi:two-component system CheB/CheR fusion protein
MDMVLAGKPSKNIAVELGISQRTVENHRASIMARTHSKSIPALARVALAAQSRGGANSLFEAKAPPNVFNRPGNTSSGHQR